jgi:hypothetical protein
VSGLGVHRDILIYNLYNIMVQHRARAVFLADDRRLGPVVAARALPSLVGLVASWLPRFVSGVGAGQCWGRCQCRGVGGHGRSAVGGEGGGAGLYSRRSSWQKMHMPGIESSHVLQRALPTTSMPFAPGLGRVSRKVASQWSHQLPVFRPHVTHARKWAITMQCCLCPGQSWR